MTIEETVQDIENGTKSLSPDDAKKLYMLIIAVDDAIRLIDERNTNGATPNLDLKIERRLGEIDKLTKK